MPLLKRETSTSESCVSANIHFLVNCSECAKEQEILNETNGEIIFHTLYIRYNLTCGWKIVANEGEQVNLELKSVEFTRCGSSCSCGHLEIQNGTYADGSTTTTRMCGALLGNVTIYSHVGHGLRIQAVAPTTSLVSFRASYTVISHKDTSFDGKQRP